MNDKENGGISLPMVISLIKKLGGDGSGAGGEYLPLSGGTMKGDITFNNNLNINMKTIVGVPKSLMNLSDEDKFIFGNQDVIAHLYSQHRPYIHVDGTTQQMAYLSDVLPKAEIQVFEELPLVGETNVMYFVKDKVESVYAIFLWDSAKRIFVLAGDSNMVLDDYYNRTQVDELFLAKAGGYMTGEIDMANEVGIIGFTPSGTKRSLIKLNSLSQTEIGDAQGDTIIRSKQPPTWNNGVSNYNFITSNGGLLTNRLALANNISLMGRDLAGQDISLIMLNNNNTIIIGTDTNKLHLRGNARPEVKVGNKVEYMALLSDITSMGSDYLPLAGGTMDGNEIFNNNVGVYGTTTSGQTKRILMLNNANNLILGEGTVPLQFSTSTRPKVNTTGGQQELAYLSDIPGSSSSDYLPLSGGSMSGSITFESGMLYGKATNGETIPLVGVAGGANVNVGASNRPLMLQSSKRPSWNDASAIYDIATLQDIDEKVGKDYRVISETLDLNGVVSTIATFDAPDIASVLADIKNYEITFNYSYTSADGKLIIENHLGVSDNNELMQINLDIPAEKNVINIKGHAVSSTISITNFVITCHIRPLNIDM